MNLKPDRLLRPLVIGLLVVASLWLVATLLSRRLSPARPQISLSPLEVPQECPTSLTRDLLARGVPATVQFTPRGTLQVTVPHSPPANGPADQGAQAIWTVFDVAVALPPECAFHRLEVTVDTGELRMQASVTGETLNDWSQGLLDEETFTDRVTYTEVTPHPP